MSAVASQITGASIVYSATCAGADQRKHQSSASLPLWVEFTGDRWNPRIQRASKAENVSFWWRHHVVRFLPSATEGYYLQSDFQYDVAVGNFNVALRSCHFLRTVAKAFEKVTELCQTAHTNLYRTIWWFLFLKSRFHWRKCLYTKWQILANCTVKIWCFEYGC